MDAINSIYRGYKEPVVVKYRFGEQPYISVPHLHSSLEIYYNIKGCRRFLVNNKFYKCDSYDMFLVPCMQIHKALLNDKNSYERCIISVSNEMIEKINGLPNMKEKPFDILFSQGIARSYKTHLSEAEHNKFISLIGSYNLDSNDDADRFIILLELLRFMSRKFKENSLLETDFSPETVADEILSFVEQNFKNPISVAQISQRMAISDAQAYRLFKKETGMTIKEYLTMRRIAEAKKLLRMGYSVKEACFESGFNDYPNFIKAFKKAEGYSPGQMEELNSPI